MKEFDNVIQRDNDLISFPHTQGAAGKEILLNIRNRQRISRSDDDLSHNVSR
jgi:hypothetical protein